MKKIIFLVLIASLLLVNVSSLEFDYVYDGADLYTDEEEASIALFAEDVYSRSGLLTVVVTDYGIYDMLDSLPHYSSGAEDMLLLSVDMQAREFEVYQYNATVGEDAFRVSYNESEAILDSIFQDMADGRYADAAIMFAKLAEEYFTNSDVFDSGSVGDGYEYTDYPEEELSVIDYFFTGMLFGAVIGGVTVLIVWLTYKRKVHGEIYPLGQFADLMLTENRDTFITKNVVVTVIPDPPSSSGGSGRSGGFGGGGGGARMGGRSF